MKKILSGFFVLILIACNNKKDENSNPSQEEFMFKERSEVMMWRADLDSMGYLLMKQDMPALLDSTSVDHITKFLNDQWPRVQLVYQKTSNDTVYYKIPESTYLTQQMGSSGPIEFFATVVYNITKIPGIKFVKFDFEEGDHAQPDVLSRDSFKDQ